MTYGQRERIFFSGFCEHYDYEILEVTKEDGYDYYEGVIFSKKKQKKYVVEVKIRSSYLTSYPNFDVLIECDKIEHLKEKTKEKDCSTALYISVYRDYITISDIFLLDQNLTEQMQQQSQKNKKKIKKKICYNTNFIYIKDSPLLNIYQYNVN